MEEHGSRAIAGYIAMMGEFDLEDFLDSYQGEFETETDFVEQTLKESGILAQLEQIYLSDYQKADQYLDFEKIATDWFINDYYSRDMSDHKVLVYTRS
jgi:antirestriction protein